MNSNTILRAFLGFATLVFFASCDKDFNEIGVDIVGEDHFLFEKNDTYSIVANTVATGPVQSNNLPINPLGIYDNPAFGKTKASFVTQIELKTPNPTFTNEGTAPVIESVELYIPYFSELEETESDGDHIYTLDSIFGQIPGVGRINLGIYESTYFLRDLDHNSEGELESQRYYTNQAGEITYNPNLLNDQSASENNTAFSFKAVEHKEIVVDDEGESETKRRKPGMKLELDKDFFYSKIFQAPAGVLQNNNAFKNYFRGLYFKVDDSPDGAGHMAMLNFADGVITIKYEQDLKTVTNVDGNEVVTITREDKTLELNLKGNTVSLIENDLDPDYATGLAQPFSVTEGHENLFIKGNEGSVAIIDLFGPDTDNNNVPDELEELRTKDWLINEASLTFHINTSQLGATASEPQRIYLYDVKNKTPLVDYYFDNTAGSSAKLNKNIHSGLIVKEPGATGRGIKYKLRITNYMRDLLKDSTNVRLGLSVTETINNISNARLRNNSALLNNYLPVSSVMNPLGTILYGTSLSVPEDKRLKLEIYYTEKLTN